MPHCQLPTPGPVDFAVWNFQSKATVGILVTSLPTVLICSGIVYSHAVNGASNRHLKYLITPVLMPAIYAVISLFSIVFYAAGGYLEPLPRIFEALAILSFYKYLQVCCESVQQKPDLGRLSRILISLAVYQLPLTLTILFVASEVLTANICLLTDTFRLGRLVINVCAFIVIIVAVLGVLVYLRRCRHILRTLSPVKKFCVLKLMIVVVTLEYLIIETAVQKSHIAVKTHTSFYDWYRGIPTVVVACEMPLFAAAMSWAFPVADATILVESQAIDGGVAVVEK